jgi:hypothetical protein
VLTAPPALVATATPTIAGTAEPGSIVRVFFDEAVAGTATASTDGTWSLTPETALGEGPHTVTATATDAAGNTSPASSPSPFVVDTVGPATPVVTSPADGVVVHMRRPTITGTAEVGSTVTVILDGAEVGKEAVSDTGTWSFTPAEALALGSHTLAARGMDAAGNPGPASVPTSFTISTTVTIRVQEGGCATAPTSTAGWVAFALGIGCLRRRRRGQRVQSPADPQSPAAAAKDSGSLAATRA